MFITSPLILIIALTGVINCYMRSRKELKTALLGEKNVPLMAILDMTDINEHIQTYVEQTIQSGLSKQIEQKIRDVIHTEIDSILKNRTELANLTQPIDMEIDEMKKEVEMMYQIVRGIQNDVNSMEGGKTHGRVPTKVAFTAIHSKSISLASEEVINYDKVITNVGNAYDPTTGIFTAPAYGVYSLSVSMMGDPNNGIHLQLMKNGDELVRLWTGGDDSYELATQTINVELSRNDRVWVQRRAGTGTKLYGGGQQYNVFSAVLVFD